MSPSFGAGDSTILVGGAPRWAYDANQGAATPAAVVVPSASPITNFAFSPSYGSDRLLFAGVADPGSVATVHRCVDDVCQHSAALAGVRAAPELAVSPTFATDGRVWAWSGRSLFRSDDRGMSYTSLVLPPGGTVGTVLVRAKTTYVGLWAHQSGSGGGLFATDDGGSTWQKVGDERFAGGVTALVVLGDRMVAAVASPMGAPTLLRSTDRGATWTPAK
jgi:hypothetical protein